MQPHPYLQAAERRSRCAERAAQRGISSLVVDHAHAAKAFAAKFIADKPATVFGKVPDGIDDADRIIQRMLELERNVLPVIRLREAVAA